MADRPHVVLVSPDGHDTTASTPAAVNNLVYGSGYKVKSGTVEDAIKKLRPNVAQQAAVPVEKPTSQAQTAPDKK